MGERVEMDLIAIGYVRVSTADQGATGAGIDAQRAAIARHAEARGWQLLTVAEDVGMSGASLERRPGLQGALEVVREGRAGVLVVSKLDRLSRSVADFASLLEAARREGWGLVALDLGVDTTTPSGELVANVMAAVAQWERRAIGQRTREALAARRSQGVRLGRPPALSHTVVSEIAELRARGMTYAAIADDLNARGIATARGGACWWPSSVRAVVRSIHARKGSAGLERESGERTAR